LFETESTEGFADENEFIENAGGEFADSLMDFNSSKTKLDNAGSDEDFFPWQFGEIMDQRSQTFFVTGESVVDESGLINFLELQAVGR